MISRQKDPSSAIEIQKKSDGWPLVELNGIRCFPNFQHVGHNKKKLFYIHHRYSAASKHIAQFCFKS